MRFRCNFGVVRDTHLRTSVLRFVRKHGSRLSYKDLDAIESFLRSSDLGNVAVLGSALHDDHKTTFRTIPFALPIDKNKDVSTSNDAAGKDSAKNVVVHSARFAPHQYVMLEHLLTNEEMAISSSLGLDSSSHPVLRKPPESSRRYAFQMVLCDPMERIAMTLGVCNSRLNANVSLLVQKRSVDEPQQTQLLRIYGTRKEYDKYFDDVHLVYLKNRRMHEFDLINFDTLKNFQPAIDYVQVFRVTHALVWNEKGHVDIRETMIGETSSRVSQDTFFNSLTIPGLLNTLVMDYMCTGVTDTFVSLCMHFDSINNWIMSDVHSIPRWIESCASFERCRYHVIDDVDKFNRFMDNYRAIGSSHNILIFDTRLFNYRHIRLNNTSGKPLRVVYNTSHRYAVRLRGSFNYFLNDSTMFCECDQARIDTFVDDETHDYDLRSVDDCFSGALRNRLVHLSNIYKNIVKTDDNCIESLFRIPPALYLGTVYAPTYLLANKRWYWSRVMNLFYRYQDSDSWKKRILDIAVLWREEADVRSLSRRIIEARRRLRTVPCTRAHVAESRSLITTIEAMETEKQRLLTTIETIVERVLSSCCVICYEKAKDYLVVSCCRNVICCVCFDRMNRINDKIFGCPFCTQTIQTYVPFIVPREESRDCSANDRIEGKDSSIVADSSNDEVNGCANKYIVWDPEHVGTKAFIVPSVFCTATETINKLFEDRTSVRKIVCIVKEEINHQLHAVLIEGKVFDFRGTVDCISSTDLRKFETYPETCLAIVPHHKFVFCQDLHFVTDLHIVADFECPAQVTQFLLPFQLPSRVETLRVTHYLSDSRHESVAQLLLRIYDKCPPHIRTLVLKDSDYCETYFSFDEFAKSSSETKSNFCKFVTRKFSNKKDSK